MCEVAECRAEAMHRDIEAKALRQNRDCRLVTRAPSAPTNTLLLPAFGRQRPYQCNGRRRQWHAMLFAAFHSIRRNCPQAWASRSNSLRCAPTTSPNRAAVKMVNSSARAPAPSCRRKAGQESWQLGIRQCRVMLLRPLIRRRSPGDLSSRSMPPDLALRPDSQQPSAKLSTNSTLLRTRMPFRCAHPRICHWRDAGRRLEYAVPELKVLRVCRYCGDRQVANLREHKTPQRIAPLPPVLCGSPF